MKVVILCGGSGTRLWPLSRTTQPKQFVKIFDDESLYQKTIVRNSFLNPSYSIILNQKQFSICKKQSNVENINFLLEPIGRNTAPAIALAAFNSDPDETLLVLPSDHLINKQAEYESCIKKAIHLANEDNLVTFGIEPEYPETGYGYIEANGADVTSFKEKPDFVTAQTYVEAGNYFWNSGMFCFKAKTYLDELKEHSPKIYHASKNAYENKNLVDKTITFNEEDFRNIPGESIDYAVMEKSRKVKVVKASIGWNDLGSYDSLAKHVKNYKDVVQINSNNNLIIGNKKIITTIDVDDLYIIDTDDAILIGKKGSSQKVKDIVVKLKEIKPELLD